MNVADVTIDHTLYKNKDRLSVMFEKQEELRQLYGIPILELDVPAHQSIAREMAWNTVEEIGESLEVYTGPNPRMNREHLLDEVADSTSFYLELLLISGLKAEDLIPIHSNNKVDSLENWFENDKDSYITDLRKSHSIFTEKLALAINRLKNRKWRKTHVHTNIFLYRKDLYMTFLNFIRVVKCLGVTPHEFFDVYLRKAHVNKWRVESRY